MIKINIDFNTVLRVVFFAIGLLAFTLWFGIFNSGNPISERLIMLFVLIIYASFPFVLKRFEGWSDLFEDQRNIFLLSAAGLLPVFAINETLDKGFLSSDFIFATTITVCIFIYILFVVKKESQKYTKIA